MDPRPSDPASARRLTFWVTGASVATAALLTGLKLFGWAAAGSTALLASLADSGLDLAAAVATFIAVRVAAVPPDHEHRFGHGKAEAFSSLLQAGLVFATAALVAQEAVRRLLSPGVPPREDGALVVMGVSVVATGLLLLAQTEVLRRTSSLAVSGDRAHYLADLGANLAALVGIGLARATGIARFDAAAGLVVSLWLVWGAVKVFREAGDHLMDRELDDAERQAVVDVVLSDPDVLGVHDLRTRAAGPSLHIQMHVDLDPALSLAEAHRIVDDAETRVMASFPNADVLIHADPVGIDGPGRFGRELASRTA